MRPSERVVAQTTEHPPRGELTAAILRILGDAPAFETRHRHYAHVRGPGRLEALLGVVDRRPDRNTGGRAPEHRPRSGKA